MFGPDATKRRWLRIGLRSIMTDCLQIASAPASLAVVRWNEVDQGRRPLKFCRVAVWRRFRAIRTRHTHWVRQAWMSDALALLDCDPEVEAIQVWPAHLEWTWQGASFDLPVHFLVKHGLHSRFVHCFDNLELVGCPAVVSLGEQLEHAGFGWRPLHKATWLDPETVAWSRALRSFAWRTVDLDTELQIRSVFAVEQSVAWSDIASGRRADIPCWAASRLIFDGLMVRTPAGRLRPESRVCMAPCGDHLAEAVHGSL